MKIQKVFAPTLFVLILTALDQFSKYLASANLMFKDDILIIPYVLSLTYHQNSGAAFGIFQGGRWFFLIAAAVVTIAIGYYYITLPKGGIYTWLKFLLCVILAGALGNSVDRLINGYVVDFLQFEFINFPIFNVADIYVVTGTILMCFTIMFLIKEDESAGETSK